MGLYNLKGERESLGQRGENYKKSVIRYLESQDYILVEDSSTHGGTDDLVFKKPATEGNREFHVETKNTDLSLSDEGLIAEMGRFFLQYTSLPLAERFDQFIFARTLTNVTRWKHVFDPKLQREDEVESLFESICSSDNLQDGEIEKLNRRDIDDFHEFLIDCVVFQGDYRELSEWSDQHEETGEFQSEFFTTEKEPITGSEEITANYYRISEPPEQVYSFELISEAELRKIRDLNPHFLPYWIEEDRLYTLIQPSEMPEELTYWIDTSSGKQEAFSEFSSDSEQGRTAQILLQRLITQDAVERGCISEKHHGRYKLFFPHTDLTEETNSKSGRQVSRVYSDDDVPNFVRHRAVNLDVRRYDNDFYIFVTTSFLFTEDGEAPVSGASASRLHDSFRSSYERNSRIRGYLDQWEDILGLGQPKPYDDPQQIGSVRSTSLTMNKRPARDSSEQKRINTETTLGDFQ